MLIGEREGHETPALSPSIGNLLIGESPLHAWTVHRLLGKKPRPTTDAQIKGRVVHELLLGKGDGLVVVEADSWRTKAAKEQRDEALQNKKTPVLYEKMKEYGQAVERIGQRMAKLGVRLHDGTPEVRLEWREDTERGEVLCHGQLDWLYDTKDRIVEVKTGDGSVHPMSCAKKMVEQGGAMQAAAYLSAARAQWPEHQGRTEILFLFCETKEPYAVTAATMAGTMQELGEAQWSRAVDTWARCLATDHWPPPSEGITRLDAPAWAVAREIQEEW